MNSHKNQLIGAVIVKTTTTAIPIPTEALIFLEIAKNEQNLGSMLILYFQ